MVVGKAAQGLHGNLEQQVVHASGLGVGDRPEPGRQGKGEHEVGRGQQFGGLSRDPVAGMVVLAAGAGAVATGSMLLPGMLAVMALPETATEHPATTILNGL